MLRIPSALRFSLLVSAVAFVGLASFPGTAAEARSTDEASEASAALVADAPELESITRAELEIAPVVATRAVPRARPSAFTFDTYRR